MPQRRTVRSRRVSNKGWASLTSFDTNVPASTTVLVGQLNLSNPGIDETVIRAVGLLGIRSDQLSASESIHGALGMIVATETAIGAGAASVPQPITDASDDGWSLYVPFMERLTFADASGFDSHGQTLFSFDSKAKRIVHDGSGMAIVLQNSATSGMTFSLIFRVLSLVRGTG